MTMYLLPWLWVAVLAIVGLFMPLAGRDRSGIATEPRRVATNVLLGMASMATALLLPAASVLAALAGGAEGLGLMRLVNMPAGLHVCLTFAACDLVNWAWHRLSHHWGPLWRLHRVHHADPAIDVLTSFRQHPLGFWLSALVQAAAALLLGYDAGGLAAYQLVLAFHLPLHHANIAWLLPPGWLRPIGWLLVTPGQHSLHHSARVEETDSNFGQVFSLWDRLGGTLRCGDAGHLARLRIGLGPRYDPGANRIGAQLALPLAPLEGPATDSLQ